MDGLKKAEIVEEAQARFDRCVEWEATARALYDQDIRFVEADADNGYQWDTAQRRQRQIKRKPSLTINKTRQYCMQIINDARQNKSQIRVVPVGDDASQEAAKVFEGVVRHIEYISNAQGAYISAVTTQVKGGIGYWRVATDYKNNTSNDQEIFIRRIKDPMTVYMDPDMRDEDGSDARFAIVFEDIPKDLFEKKYPKYKDQLSSAALDNTGNSWVSKDMVRVAEYYRKSDKRDTLIIDKNGTAHLKSVIKGEIAAALLEDPETKSREVLDPQVEWFLIIGDEIAETTKWAGKYIPIVRVIGEETIVDGILDRKGHTRALKDPQRMYNYWASAATEQIALQTRTPWIAPVKTIEGFEEVWKNSAVTEPTVLPYRATDDAGQPLGTPQRIEPPTIGQAYMAGLEVSEQQMQMVSGQHEATMGEPSNEKSGKAINARQRQGENATYHFIDNFASAIRFTGKILIDLIPKIYDTQRVIQILAENGDRSAVTIDPSAPVAHQQNGDDENAQIIFNPTIGEYDVESGIGPNYATKRQEAFDAFIQIAASSPEIMQKAGDIMFKAADFPMAEDIAERLKPGPTPEMEKAAQQIQKQQETIQHLMQQLVDAKQENESGNAKHQIEEFRAMTDRMEAIKTIDPEALVPIVRQMVAEAMGMTLPAMQAMHGLVPGTPQAAGSPQPQPGIQNAQ